MSRRTADAAPDLARRHCRPCEGGVPPLAKEEIGKLLEGLPEWRYGEGCISRTCTFKNHYQAMAFVNAVAWISHGENHHPDLEVGFNTCRVRYRTHAIGGLSENDFICAAKVEALFSPEE